MTIRAFTKWTSSRSYQIYISDDAIASIKPSMYGKSEIQMINGESHIVYGDPSDIFNKFNPNQPDMRGG